MKALLNFVCATFRTALLLLLLLVAFPSALTIVWLQLGWLGWALWPPEGEL